LQQRWPTHVAHRFCCKQLPLNVLLCRPWCINGWLFASTVKQ
jgi:hypothetical protein